MPDAIYLAYAKEPFISADVPAVTLSTVNKALYPPSSFPALPAQFFQHVNQKMIVEVFGRISTGATPGNLTLSLLFGNGADADGVVLVASAAQVLLATQTNVSWSARFVVHCRALGAFAVNGALFAVGEAKFGVTVIAAGSFLLPATAPAAVACDLLKPSIFSLQALRSGSTAETMQIQDMLVTTIN